MFEHGPVRPSVLAVCLAGVPSGAVFFFDLSVKTRFQKDRVQCCNLKDTARSDEGSGRMIHRPTVAWMDRETRFQGCAVLNPNGLAWQNCSLPIGHVH